MLNPFYIKSSFITQEKRLAAKGKGRNRKQKVTEAGFFRSSLYHFPLFFFSHLYMHLTTTKILKQIDVGIDFLVSHHELSALFENDKPVLFSISNYNSLRCGVNMLYCLSSTVVKYFVRLSETYQIYSMIKISKRNYTKDKRVKMVIFVKFMRSLPNYTRALVLVKLVV